MFKLKNRLIRRTASLFTAAAMLLSQPLFLTQQTADAASGTDIYVGYSGKNNNYSTVSAALNACKQINPTSESQRITVHIAPGTYREQLVVQTPYITFVNDEVSKGDVILTWYYGIGYKYFSVGSDGRYNASNAAAKSNKAEPTQRWGGTVQLLSKATDFKAENIVFENSFNRYVTQEEIADGVTPSGSQSINFNRTAWNADVRSKAATERGAALTIDGDRAEFYNCKLLGSQDTLYTGSNVGYFKNCKIEGNTDYIFGSGDYVFDQCELSFFGYSSTAVGGYITAARQQTKGYLFNKCNITGNTNQSVSSGYLGRPWSATASVLFYNTTIANDNLIKPEGWTSMSGVEPTQASFKEYGTKLANGSAVNLWSRKGNVLSDSDAATVKVTNYLGSWTPTFLNKTGTSSNPSGDTQSSSVDAISLCGGWYESAYAQWDSSEIGSNVTVSYKEHSASSYIKADSQLIRNNRVDIPGLKGNTSYDVKISGSSGTAECTVTTMSYDRSGYAHWKQSDGVGAYNNDGTPKANATILYVTDANKDTVSFGGQTGLYNILYKSKGSNLIIRIIGDVNVPSGATPNNGSSNDGSNMLYMQNMSNITIEGVGYDAHLVRWGFEIKRSSNIEVRNLYFYQYPDDAIGVTGDSSHKSDHIWIHNNTFGIGKNEYAGNGTVDDDKAQGDGSTDIKWTEYVTISYNHYVGCHKTSLVGGGTNHLQDWITYHHNWFDGTESRNPRVRNSHVHSYNNYFKGNTQYGIGASYNSKVFSEANYFESCKLPLDTEAMGSDQYSGTIKSFGDKLVNCSGNSIYTAVNSRNASANIGNLVGGGDSYDNFDINSSLIYLGQYTTQSPDDAKNTVMAFAGRMQNKDYGNGSAVTPSNPAQPSQPSSTDYTFNASSLSTGSYSSDIKVNSMYTVKVNASEAVAVANHSITASDGSFSASNRLHLGGKGSTVNRSVQVNAPKAGWLKVYMMSSNSADVRTVNLLDSSGNIVTSVSNVNGTSLDAYTLEVPSDGTFYVSSNGSGLYIFKIIYTENPNAPVEQILLGDLNKDGSVDSFDLAVLRGVVNNTISDSYAKKAADFNSDGKTDSADIDALTAFILGK